MAGKRYQFRLSQEDEQLIKAKFGLDTLNNLTVKRLLLSPDGYITDAVSSNQDSTAESLAQQAAEIAVTSLEQSLALEEIVKRHVEALRPELIDEVNHLMANVDNTIQKELLGE